MSKKIRTFFHQTGRFVIPGSYIPLFWGFFFGGGEKLPKPSKPGFEFEIHVLYFLKKKKSFANKIWHK